MSRRLAVPGATRRFVADIPREAGAHERQVSVFRGRRSESPQQTALRPDRTISEHGWIAISKCGDAAAPLTGA